MNLTRRAAFACAFCAPQLALAQPAPGRNQLTPEQSRDRLMAGNQRFVADAPAPPENHAGRRQALALGQAPFAAILGCADSRTPPEALFRATLGEVFTVRNAGNSIFPEVIGSLEYAVNALGVSLILVLGHERCGAISAAVQVAESGNELPGDLMSVIEPILGAVASARRENPADLLDATVKLHARRTARRLRDRPSALTPALASRALQIEAAYYDLDNGRVTILDR